ncbi:glycoside hydrolase family 30 protein [Mucilaginibacter agri]|uniref:Glycosyl hydrolase n=1 Tax=Mucilaginibacter agri TaxID=2695265 RepID=A0A965ZJG2_9SPHI|nr:glycoside hydrolase family 30 beta sandwich domain-containing protein [Mucilaginibacter agri]NCD71187.1 glycosyl hydrolase [Mucilaginibacter agri]
MKKSKLFLYATACGLIAMQSGFSQTKPTKYTVANKGVKVFTTAKNTDLKISATESLSFTDKPQPAETEVSVFVDPDKKFQTLVGIGGALTDASAETFYKLPKDKQKELMTAYFDKTNGIGYTMGRTHIQSSDFSSDSYSYIADGDADLKTFSVAHDEKYRIPFIKEAIAAAGGKLNVFVTPWSPPAFMKTNNNMLRGGKLKPEFAQNWANFYVKFINTYEKKGIPVWGLSVQNEPMATQSWESCIYTADDERVFIKKYLGPTLAKAGLGSKKLMAWDHNRDLMYQQASTILGDPDAAKYVWGIAYHWYETWTGAGMNFESERRTHEAFPDKQLMFTEGCLEKFDYDKIKDWALGEKYGYSMINDFNAGTAGWTDWNILLDEKGGPNHVGNFCFAPVHADTRSGELIYTNAFYYIGQISKFVKPGAKRIAVAASRDKLLSTAFQNPDGKVVVIVMNQSDDKIPYFLWIKGKAAKTESLPHSMSTLIVE